MRKKQAVIIIASMIISLFITLEVAKSSSDKTVLTGKDVYRLNCAGCHGIDRSGYSDIYPSLLNIKERFSEQ